MTLSSAGGSFTNETPSLTPFPQIYNHHTRRTSPLLRLDTTRKACELRSSICQLWRQLGLEDGARLCSSVMVVMCPYKLVLGTVTQPSNDWNPSTVYSLSDTLFLELFA